MRIGRNFAAVALSVAIYCPLAFCQVASAAGSSDPSQAAPPSAAAPAASRQNLPAQSRRQFQGVMGEITAVRGNQLTLKTMDGKMATVTLNDKTAYRKDGQDAKQSDFKVGDRIAVRGEQKDDGAWSAQTIITRSSPGLAALQEGMGKQFIIGEIKSIDGLKLTILRPDGQTQVIAVDESTSFRKDGQSVTLGDFKVGDQVYGRGALKDGVLVPSVLNNGELRFGTGGTPQPAAPPQ